MFFGIVATIGGLFCLVKGADWLVDGASSLAKRLGIAPIVIGLTVVAFGTSAPELVVNIVASFQGNTDIAIGNIIGSNIANVLLILGVSGLIYPLAVKRGTTWKEIPLALLAVVLVWIMVNDHLMVGRSLNGLDRIDGLVLLSFFIIFFYYTFGIRKAGDGETDAIVSRTMFLSWSLIFAGLAGLVVGGKLSVDGATAIAKSLGISDRIIALTVVAIGTSLPELLTSAVAAYKKQADIAVGNVVGSNIFNVFWVLGLSSVLRPLPFSAANSVDVFVAIGATFLLFLTMFIGKRHHLERWQGGAFLGLYIGYIGFLVISG